VGAHDRNKIMRWLWKLFENPAVYRLNQQLTGYLLSLAYRRLLRRHLELRKGETVLDVGCGTGDYAADFPDQQYIGVDINPAYIERARVAFSRLPNVSFQCLDLNTLGAGDLSADCAYCVAVTHHLTDQELLAFVHTGTRLARRRFVVVDLYLPPVWRNPLGHLLVKLDRGRYGRSKERLLEVLGQAGPRITAVSFDFGFPYPALGVTFATHGPGGASDGR
jgi:SAM-dependent methyltransferase